MLLLALTSNGAWAQSTTLLTEDFEAGNSFTLVGNSSTTSNKWVRGTAAETASPSVVGSAYSLYVSNASTTVPATYAYTGTSATATVHAYRDVAIPAGQSAVVLSFSWKGTGDPTIDYLRVSCAPTTFTPTASTTNIKSGVALSGSGTGTATTLVDNLANSATYGTQTVALPTNLAGTTVRLIVTWSNDASGSFQPPAAVDNVVLTSAVAVPLCGVKSVGPSGDYPSLTSAFTALNANGLCGPLALELQAAYTSTVETLPLMYKYVGTSTNTVTVRPAAGATGLSISSASANVGANATFTINGGQYLILDGRPGGSASPVSGAALATDLVVANTSTAGVALLLTGDASNSLVRHCQLQGVGIYASSTYNPVINFGSATAGGNSNNTLQYNRISGTSSTNVPQALVYSGSALNAANTIANNNMADFYTGGDSAYGIYLLSAGNGWTISGNSLYQTASRASVSSSYMYGIYAASGGGHTIAGNFIGGSAAGATGSPLTISTGSPLAYRFVGIQAGNNTLAMTVQNNTIANIAWYSSSTASSLSGVWTGIYLAGNATVQGNTVGGSTTITSTNSNGTSYGILSTTAPTQLTIIGNNIGSLTATGYTASLSTNLAGIVVAGTTNTVMQNRVYGLSVSGAAGTCLGISATAGTTNLYNNVVGNLTAPAATGSNAVQGLLLGGSVVSAYYNTVYLSGTSSGNGFGASGIACTTAPTSIDLRNNLVVANATATGTGLVVALRLTTAGTTGTVPGNLATTLNNNLLSGPYLYAEGLALASATNVQTTLFGYRNFMYNSSGREQRAVSQNVAFASLTGTDANFLQPNATTPTPVESGGQPLSSITTDYAGAMRSTTTPDIGAYEGTYTYLDQVAPAITYSPLSNTASTTSRTFTNVVVTDVAPGSGVNGTTGTRPRLYYKLSTDANAYNANTSTTAGWKYAEASGSTSPFSFTIDYSKLPSAPAVGTVIQYFVVAQDLAATPNVAAYYGTFAAAQTSVALTGTAFPIGGTLTSYTIEALLPTTILVGTGQTYTSLTNTGGVFDAINNGTLAGNTTVTITSDLTNEAGTVALNALADGGNNYTLTIQSDGTLRAISGAVASGLFRLAGANRVTFTGAQPGATSQNLRFSNTASSGPTFVLTADASNNTLTNLVVESANDSPASGTIVLGSGTTTGNNNNSFINLDIRSTGNATTTATYAVGVYSAGLSSTVANTGNTVSNGTIRNFSGRGIFLASNSTGWVITGNKLYQEATRTTSFSGLTIYAGDNHTITGNSIYQTAGTVNGFAGIYLIGNGTGHTVSGNFIGGTAASATGGALSSTGDVTGIFLAVGTATLSSVQGNVIRAISVATSTGATTYGISVTAGAVNVGGTTGNVIGGATAAQSITANYGITGIQISSNVASVVSNNEVRSLLTSANPGAGLSFYGLYVSGSAGHTIANNTVAGIVNASLPDDANGYNAQTVGIFSAATGAVLLANNQVSNIGNTATSTGTAYGHQVIGLRVQGATAGYQVLRNRTYTIYTSTTGTGLMDFVSGLVTSGTGGTVANNQLSLATGTATAPGLYGVYENGTSNTYAYNSVYLAGTGTSNTFAFYRTSTTAFTLRNNIFYNERTGSGYNQALGTSSSTGYVGSPTSPATNSSDYNLFFVTNASRFGYFGGPTYSFADWKTGTGGDGSSMSELNAVVPSASLFTNTATGDLSLNVGNSAAWYANGTGVQLPGLGTDYSGAARPTTVAAGAPDIGSVEVTPTATPPALAVSAAPSLGSTQTFSLGGRTLASLAWGSGGTVPTSVTARYYSGTNPPAPFLAMAKYANVYFTFANDNADGSGFTYTPTFNYDPALLGTIATEANQRVAQRGADNNGYDVYATTVSTTTRTLTGPQYFNRLSLFAISDATNPLPVTLTRFEAARQSQDAALNWHTASEVTNAGFEVQVSTDGQSFRKLGFVAAATAGSSAAHAYAFLDQEADKAGRRYYRLRQLDLDGSEHFSPVRTVEFDVLAVEVSAAPNPFQQSLAIRLSLPTASTATLTLADALGRVVRTQALGQLAAGTSQPTLDGLGNLPAGVYVLRLSLAGSTHMLKVVKE